MGKFIDIIGHKFGRLTVISRAENDKGGNSKWNCVCECGNTSIVARGHLRSGATRSCGCLHHPNILDRLDKCIDKSSDCWMWTARVDRDGYGVTFYKNKRWQAHRLIYKLFVGEIPPNMCVCHKNDIPADVTPSNLFLGTINDNNKDRNSKGRQSRGEKVRTSKLKENQVLAIRKSELSNIELAEIYGVYISAIVKIKTRKTWKHI